VKQRNEEADETENVLRLSIDAKARVKVGPFARGGKSRVPTKACTGYVRRVTHDEIADAIG
jgi:hypothetical protein